MQASGITLPRRIRLTAGSPAAATAESPPPQPSDLGSAPAGTVLLIPAEAAARLGISQKLLRQWRSTGDGPTYVRLTPKTIRYHPEALDAFVAARNRVSTAGG